MKTGYWIVLGIVALVAVIIGADLLAGGTLPLGEQAELTKDMGPAPNFVVKIIDGRKVSLKDFKGKPLIINFWASWCPPCREETPLLVETAKRYKGRVDFLGIVFQDTVANVRQFYSEFDIPYPSAVDPTEAASQAYKITGVPETFFIDAKGHLRGQVIGAINKETLTKMIDETLAAGD